MRGPASEDRSAARTNANCAWPAGAGDLRLLRAQFLLAHARHSHIIFAAGATTTTIFKEQGGLVILIGPRPHRRVPTAATRRFPGRRALCSPASNTRIECAVVAALAPAQTSSRTPSSPGLGSNSSATWRQRNSRTPTRRTGYLRLQPRRCRVAPLGPIHAPRRGHPKIRTSPRGHLLRGHLRRRRRAGPARRPARRLDAPRQGGRRQLGPDTDRGQVGARVRQHRGGTPLGVC
mmetsp:Transcript_21704/g.74612  ORF Transcript_21704/g.74612 Transcript_21704/m.74612 type:complete len:234 (-) Transcript_21704:319-1020(-)